MSLLANEGMPKEDKWYSIALTSDSITISEETEMVGKGNYTVAKTLSERLGGKQGVITIGPAGEMKLSAARHSRRALERLRDTRPHR